MSIDLKQLKYFLAVAEEKSFSRAAERLHISQPPLSQQIMKLEAELGVKLFARTTRTFELTVAGKALMQEASDLLAKMRMTIDTVRQIDRGEVGRLRVGQDYTHGASDLLRYLVSQAFIPEYQVRFRWKPNSMAMWDNRSTQHYAVMDYPPCHRKMERAGIVGEATF